MSREYREEKIVGFSQKGAKCSKYESLYLSVALIYKITTFAKQLTKLTGWPLFQNITFPKNNCSSTCSKHDHLW